MTLRVPSLLGEPQWKIRCGHRLEPTIASAQLLMQFMVPLKMWRLAKLRLLLWVTPTTASGGAKTNAHQAIVVTPALKIPKHRGEFIAKVGGAVSIPPTLATTSRECIIQLGVMGGGVGVPTRARYRATVSM